MDNDNKEPQSLFDKYKESVHNSRKEEYPNFFSEFFSIYLRPVFIVIFILIMCFGFGNSLLTPTPDNTSKYTVESNSPTPTEYLTATPYVSPTPQEKTVFVTPTGECYHKYAHGRGSFSEVPLSEALSRNLRPCMVCSPQHKLFHTTKKSPLRQQEGNGYTIADITTKAIILYQLWQ